MNVIDPIDARPELVLGDVGQGQDGPLAAVRSFPVTVDDVGLGVWRIL